MIIVELQQLADPITFAVIHPRRLFSDSGYMTLGADTPAYQYYDARLKTKPSWSRGGQAQWMEGGGNLGSTGNIELANADGALDALLVETIKGRRIRIMSIESGAAISTAVVLHTLYADRCEADEQSLIIFCTSTAQLLDKTIVSTNYSGTGTALDGQPLPFCIGTCFNVPAHLYDPALLRYRVHTGPVYEITRVMDNGDELTPIAQWVSISGGFELLQAPVGKITADVKGEPGGALGWLHTLVDIGQYLTTLCGLSFGQAGITNLSNLQAAIGATEFGYFTENGGNVRDVLTQLLESVSGWWSETQQGLLAYARLERPSLLTAGLSFDERNMTNTLIRVTHDRAPNFTPVVLAQRNWHINSASEIAGAVIGTPLGVALQRLYRVISSPTAPTIGTGAADDARLPVKGKKGFDSLISSQTQSQAEANRKGNLYPGGPPLLIQFEVIAPTLASIPIIGSRIDLTSHRFGLSAGKPGQVLFIASGSAEDAIVITARFES